MARDNRSLNRRDLLKAAGASTVGIAGLAGCSGNGGEQTDGGGGDQTGGGDTDSGGDGGSEDYPALGNYPIEGDTAIFGFNVPQSGPYASEGQDELRAYQLAVKHLNEGGGWVDSQFDDLSGDGVLDYTIDYVDGDTATDADTARQSASRMIQRDNAIMITGGSSSATAIAMQGLCQNENVLFMACLTHSNDTTGKDCAMNRTFSF
jgi:ABC-type branched-subunit amino acid transport system substrate-binding protein